MSSHFLIFIGKLVIGVIIFGLLHLLRVGWMRSKPTAISPADNQHQLDRILLACSAWLLFVALLALNDFWVQAPQQPWRWAILLTPPLLGLLVGVASPTTGQRLQHLPKSWLFYAQSGRILTELFFWLGWQAGLVPLQMTFLWLNFDYTVGLTAGVAGRIFAGQGRFLRFESILWNTFGIVLLLNNLVIAFYSLTAPWRVFRTDPGSDFLLTFPFIWIPAFIMPCFLGLHLLTLRQLFATPRQGNRQPFRIRR